MNKKILIGMGLLIFLSVGITIFLNINELSLTEKEMVNKDFEKYNGIYKLKKCEFRVFHNEDKISFQVFKNKEPNGINNATIEENIVEIDEYKLEFLNGKMKVKSKNPNILSGEYKKVSGYSTDSIYKDYIGDISYYDNNYNGVYENDEKTIYTVQINKDELRIKYTNEDEEVNINLSYLEKDKFNTNFFDTIYDLKYDQDNLELNINSKEEKNKIMNGKYTRVKKLNKVEIIKTFVD